MRTPKNYTDNLKNGIITMEMLSECIYSVNKRAKNCRDQERKYREKGRYNRFYYDKYNTEERYREKKNEYYHLKDKFLALCKPTCIHTEIQNVRVRVYDYEVDYNKRCKKYPTVHRGEYWDDNLNEYVEFTDVIVPEKKYYLYYELPKHSFHTPIKDYTPSDYKDCSVIDIGVLNTMGNDINDLISTSFVKKVLEIIATGSYQLVVA